MNGLDSSNIESPELLSGALDNIVAQSGQVGMTAETRHPAPKCPACGSTNLHASRRRSTLENLSAFLGLSYFRCHECKLRFSHYMGGFASRSMRSEYVLLKQRAKELLVASALLTVIVAGLVWMMYHVDR
jgi:transposase-like protein